MKTFALWHSIVVHLISNCCLIVPIVLWLLFSFHQIVVWFHTINANLLSKCCLIVICLSFYCHLLLSIFFFWLSFHSCLTTLLRCTLFTVIYFCCLLHKRANSEKDHYRSTLILTEFPINPFLLELTGTEYSPNHHNTSKNNSDSQTQKIFGPQNQSYSSATQGCVSWLLFCYNPGVSSCNLV